MSAPNQPATEGNADRMDVVEALRVLAELRRPGQIVVTNQGSARLWPTLSNDPLDFNYNPSTMGGAVPLGLGLALAQPDREVLIISGDGSLLMSLGCLVTVIDSGVTNLSIVLLDNGIYEVTGGQQTPAAATRTDFAGLARAAGFPNVAHFWNIRDWMHRAPNLFQLRGSRFIWLEVQPTTFPSSQGESRPISERFEAASRQLGHSI